MSFCDTDDGFRDEFSDALTEVYGEEAREDVDSDSSTNGCCEHFDKDLNGFPCQLFLRILSHPNHRGTCPSCSTNVSRWGSTGPK